MAKRKVIIDTDPGTDDILALLLALSSASEDIEVLLISVTFGNVDVQNCLRNVVSMFNVIEKEMAWRKEQGMPEGFEALRAWKPVVAVGAREPLGGQTMMADYFHGIDGLGNVHTTHPHHTSHPDHWSHLFAAPPTDTLLSSTATTAAHIDRATHTTLFTPSPTPSHLEILRILGFHPPDTITLISIGPLTNFSLAASESATTFTKAFELIAMSGALSIPGNITPVGEFNCIADPIAAARIFALTSPNPGSTMPPESVSKRAELPDYPSKKELGDRRLNITLFPLDVTTPHTLSRRALHAKTKPLIRKGSPLAEWVSAFLSATFAKSNALYKDDGSGGDLEVAFHDPVCLWYALTTSSSSDCEADGWEVVKGRDVRVETMGQWTRGMCVVDGRGMRMREEGGVEGRGEEGDEEREVGGDSGNWLSGRLGNRLGVCVRTPAGKGLEGCLLGRLFG